MKATLPIFLLIVLLGASLAACQRTPPAPVPVPPAPASKPGTKPATPVPPAATASATGPAVRPAEPAEEWVLPGNLGPLTTRLQLEARFGKSNVREETFDGPEGDGSYQVLVIFPDDPRKRLELVQDADNPDAPIVELRISGPASQWHGRDGLRPGMSLAELVALNGAPISFYGLGWDYGGTVQDWHGGKLANAVGNKLFHRVTLSASKAAGDRALPSGDTTFRSDDGKWPDIGKDMIVAELGISWPHEGED